MKKKNKWKSLTLFIFAMIMSFIFAILVDCKSIPVANVLHGWNKALLDAAWIDRQIDFWVSIYEKLSGHDLGKFSIILSMAALGNTMVIFLYGRYQSGVYGLRAEQVIEQKMGIRNLEIYRIISMILPIIAAITGVMSLVCVPVVCAAFMYILVIKFMYLSSVVMKKGKSLEIMQTILTEEIRDSSKKLDRLVTVETTSGYAVKTETDITWADRRQIYYFLASHIIPQFFEEKHAGRELKEIVEKAYLTLIYFKNAPYEILFLYLYDLTVELLSETTEKKTQTYNWRVSLLEEVCNKISASVQDKEDGGAYDMQYAAIICGILASGNVDAESFLWFDFFEHNGCDTKIKKEFLFIMASVYMELLAKQKRICVTFYELAVRHRLAIVSNVREFQKEAWEKAEKYGFVLSLLGFGSQDEVMRCFCETKDDFRNTYEKDYMPKTILGMILVMKENNTLW